MISDKYQFLNVMFLVSVILSSCSLPEANEISGQKFDKNGGVIYQLSMKDEVPVSGFACILRQGGSSIQLIDGKEHVKSLRIDGVEIWSGKISENKVLTIDLNDVQEVEVSSETWEKIYGMHGKDGVSSSEIIELLDEVGK